MNKEFRLFNFSPGPAAIPFSVLKKVQTELTSYRGKGISIIEISHRHPWFIELLENLTASLRKLANIPETYDILYMTGGARTQYSLIPLNLALPKTQNSPNTPTPTDRSKTSSCGYIDSGYWASQAINAASELGFSVEVIASGKASHYREIPNISIIDKNYDYVHVISNNTIYGTCLPALPRCNPGTPLILDMSSDFLSKPIDWNQIDFAFACAQKNAGCAGLTIVVMKKSLYEKTQSCIALPKLWQYKEIAVAKSLLNTPPVFQIYLFSLIVDWLTQQGGLQNVQQNNQMKADLIYGKLDQHPNFYRAYSCKQNRSLMNITWTLPNPHLTRLFLKQSETANLWGLQGHKVLGGVRASLYNGVPLEACQALAGFMEEFYMKSVG